jgi:hypothetical protein
MNITEVKNFLLGGHGELTIKSLASGGHYTYRVRQAKDTEGNPLRRYFVSLLVGPDNNTAYEYIGLLEHHASGKLGFRLTRASKTSYQAPSTRGFHWLVACINTERDISEQAELLHSGRCGACGRKLTTPESIQSGLGPVCASRVAA